MKQLYGEIENAIMEEFYLGQDTVHIDTLLDMMRTKFSDVPVDGLHGIMGDLEASGIIELEGTSGYYHRLIQESMDQFKPRKQRSYHQISPMMKSMANAAKRRFAKDYPKIQVKIDGRQGWIIVNGVKAVNISSADSKPMDIEDMIDQMKKAYLGHYS